MRFTAVAFFYAKLQDDIDENEGVNVQFESDEEEEEQAFHDIKRDDEESSGDEGGVEADFDEVLHGRGFNEDDETEGKKGGLHARDVDAHWIQRSLSKFYQDPIIAQQKVAEVISILKVHSCFVFL